MPGAFASALRSEPVLRRRVDLPLELEEVGDRQVLGLEPPEEDVVVLRLARQVDVVVPGQPLPAALAGHGLEAQLDSPPLAGGEGEFDLGGSQVEPAMGLDPILARGQFVLAPAVEKNEVRLAVLGDLEGLRPIASPPPEALAVEHVHAEGQHRVHRAEPERAAVLEQVDARRDRLPAVAADRDDLEAGLERRIALDPGPRRETHHGERGQDEQGRSSSHFGNPS